jgi:hypothetical protein
MRPHTAWAICCAALATLAQMVTGRETSPKTPHRDAADPENAATFDSTPPPLSELEVWNHAMIGCPDRDIADRFLVDESRIALEFADTLRIARALRRCSIRKHQTLVAFGGKSSASMLQWLGRNELNQDLKPKTAGRPEPEIHDDLSIDDGS